MNKSQIKKLDNLWSIKVKELSKYKCESCLEENIWLNSCHIIGRRYRGTRWGAWIGQQYDLCGFSGCFACHNQYDEHGPNEGFIRRVVIGENRYAQISKIAKQSIAKNQDYEEIRKWIQQATPVKHE